MTNIISGFRCTGVVPVDRSKLSPQEEPNRKSCTTCGLYVPVLTRLHHKTMPKPVDTPSFDLEEMDFKHASKDCCITNDKKSMQISVDVST